LQTALQELQKLDRFKENKNIFAQKKRPSFYSFQYAIRELKKTVSDLGPIVMIFKLFSPKKCA
jgi:hypothetical protein